MATKQIKSKRKRTAIFGCFARTKSKMDSIKSSIAPLLDFYRDFCAETTLHGLKHTIEPKLHFLERVLWFALTMCAFAGAVYCALSQLSRYIEEPVVVSLQRDYRRWQTTFPAVTACFIDRIQPDKAKGVIQMHWNVTEDSDPDRFQYYTEFLELITDVSFRENLQNFWKYQDDTTVAGIDLLQLALSVHPANKLSVRMSHKEKEVQWNSVMTEMGMCLSLNSKYAEYQLMHGEWRQESLLACHYLSGQCYVRIDSIEHAVRFFIHSPFEISTAVSNPTGEIEPGEELIIDFKAVEIQASRSVKALTTEQRRCRYPDEWISPSVTAYSFALCQMHCRSRLAVMFCGCRPYFHVKGDGDICDAHGMACIGRNVEILINIPKNLAKCDCLPQCAEINYYSHTKKVVVNNIAVNCLLQNLSRDTYVIILPEVALTASTGKRGGVTFYCRHPTAYASLGGTTALFVGASVLTVVETAFFLVRRLVCAVLEAVYRRTNRIQFNP